MRIVDAVWLGIVQGLTEFLPISSDGHLNLAHALLGAVGNEDLFFDLVLHIGTLVAVLSVFGRDIVRFTQDGLSGLGKVGQAGFRAAAEGSEGLRMGLLIVIASVPTALIGLALKKPVEGHAFSTSAVAIMIMLNGVTLWASRLAVGKVARDAGALSVDGIGPLQALVIGIAQGLAVLPGISRSGSTIVAALLLGGERTRAAQLSFLMSVPAILGAFVLQLDTESIAHASSDPLPYAIGCVVSAGVGVLALRVLLGVVKRAGFHHFAWYCWALGLAALIWQAFWPAP